MTKLSPQKELILSYLRSGKWVCGREWLDHIKDDRKRIQELNEGYMKQKGFEILGEACKGTVCGRRDCPLFKRRAIKLVQASTAAVRTDHDPKTCPMCIQNLINLKNW